MMELVRQFKFVINNENDTVMKYNDKGEHFFIIIKGIVGIWTPNKDIRGWKLEMNKYKDSLKWIKRIEAKYVRIKEKRQKFKEDQKE